MSARAWVWSALLPLAGCAAPLASFASPDEALQALLASAEDHAKAEELLGPGGFDVLLSGDEVADRNDLAAVRALIREKVQFEDDGSADRVTALLGHDGWPLPLPLQRDEGRWRFDVDAGREEILNRRIGRNELATIATLRACVQAQREYAAAARDGQRPAFAAQWFSSEGKHDGLYWPAKDGEPESPLGPLLAAAAAEGYRRAEQPIPYHGYHYRILTGQGPAGPGGERSYLDASGRLTGGFAFIAWPATYGNSGIMTFVVNQQGIVFERDLGGDTARVGERVPVYDPDDGWTPVVD
jgi:hypothetical protein